MELATDEKTLLAFPPIRRIVPSTITKTTASITAYSATSCPCSSDHRWCNNFATGLLLPQLNIAEVVLHRVFANLEVFCRLFIGIAGNHCGHNLQFSGCEPEFLLPSFFPRGLHQSSQVLHQVGDAFASNPVFSCHDCMNGFQKKLGSGVLQHYPASPELQSLDNLIFLGGCG